MAYAKRRDANHAEIRDGLRRMGWTVYDAGSVGGDFPDLVVGAAGLTLLVEVKASGGRLSEGQAAFAADWRGGPVIVARSLDDAILQIGESIRGNQWRKTWAD